eukprot:c951_g1_i2.p1 GENE.c951_g1_i2~~c951_g1_i2.p1  ORF type:complete len:281 (-),score=43.52 c951_g1_i2:27-869(-)
MGASGASAIAHAIPRCLKLRTLFLTNNTLESEGATALALALPHCAQLQELGLMGCITEERGAAAIAAVLHFCHKLDEFYSDNAIVEQAWIEIEVTRPGAPGRPSSPPAPVAPATSRAPSRKTSGDPLGAAPPVPPKPSHSASSPNLVLPAPPGGTAARDAALAALGRTHNALKASAAAVAPETPPRQSEAAGEVSRPRPTHAEIAALRVEHEEVMSALEARHKAAIADSRNEALRLQAALATMQRERDYAESGRVILGERVEALQAEVQSLREQLKRFRS